MARDVTYPAGSNYDRQGGTEKVIGGTLVFDATTARIFTVDGDCLITITLPTSDPHVAGALYTATNVLKLSAG